MCAHLCIESYGGVMFTLVYRVVRGSYVYTSV